MAYETSAFGDGVVSGSGGNVTSNVSNHYGPRTSGGEQGVVRTAGGENEAVVNFDADGPLYDTQVIPAGAVVTDVRGYGLTGAIATATVGSQDISGAGHPDPETESDEDTYVTITTAAALTVTGPTAGQVVVKYRNYAG